MSHLHGTLLVDFTTDK